MKSGQRKLIYTFLVSCFIFLLNITQGSLINFSSDTCFPISLEFGVGVAVLIISLLLFFFKIQASQDIKIYLIFLLFASFVIYLIEPFIFQHQLNKTNNNLEITCKAITNYQIKNGKIPEQLTGILKSKNFTSGFQFFNNQFEYIKFDKENYKILYRVKFGYTCEVWNGSTFFSNMKQTCVICGTVENSKSTIDESKD